MLAEAKNKIVETLTKTIRAHREKDPRLDIADRKLAEAGGNGVIELTYGDGALRRVHVRQECKTE
jgi:hypothetical protein